MITSVPSVQFDDRAIGQFQSNVLQGLNPLLQNPIVQGNLLKGVSIVAGTNVIPHGLGRTMQGWIVTDVTAVMTLYRSAALNANNLTLTSSASGTVSIYAF